MEERIDWLKYFWREIECENSFNKVKVKVKIIDRLKIKGFR